MLALQRLQAAHQQLCLRQPNRVQLSPTESLKSLTLRLGQYSGALMDAPPPAVIETTIADGLLMTMSLASMLNVSLAEAPAGHSAPQTQDGPTLAIALVGPVGELAKAAEATDHLEDYPSRRVANEACKKLAGVWLEAAARSGLHPLRFIPQRLAAVGTRAAGYYPHILPASSHGLRQQPPPPAFPASR